jgi:hypothetical protein
MNNYIIATSLSVGFWVPFLVSGLDLIIPSSMTIGAYSTCIAISLEKWLWGYK